MKFREVFGFELEYRLRRPSTWIYAGLLFGIAVSFNLDASSSDAGHANAPAQVAFYALIMGMFSLPVSAALFGDAAVRDVQAGMDPLLFTSPLRKVEYLGGRFLAALAINALVLFAVPLGLALPVLVGHPDPAAFGPFQAGAYVQPFLLFLLPNLVLVGAILFTIATFARQVIPVYLGAIGLFIGYLIAVNYSGQVDNPLLAAMADPFGLAAFQELTTYWTTAERNTQLVGFPGTLVWNRVAWLGVAVAVLVLLHRRFRFAHADGGGRRRKGRGTIVAPGSERALPVAVPRVEGTFGLRERAWQTLSVARNSFAEVVASRAFVAVLAVGFGLVLLVGWNVGSTVFDTSIWPVTHLVAGVVLSVRIFPIIFMLIALYAGELVWKDREAGVAEIADAAPVPEAVFLLGRFLALVALLAALQAAFMAGGVALQALQGYYRFEPGLYLRILFGLNLADYVLLAALAMTVHVVVNQKYLGHIVVLMAFLFTVASSRLGIRHHLLVYGTDPGWTYSDMYGFGPFIGPFVWFKLYWAAWALLLAVVANVLWVRGAECGLRRRLLDARGRFTGPVARAAGTAVALIVVLGGFIFYNTNILNEYRTPEELGAPRAEYEKRYERFEDVPQPTMAGAELRIEIYPEEPAADLRGTYRMVNRTEEAIDSVHVSFIDPDIQVRSISFDRTAESVLVDDEVSYRIYALERALEPGESLQLAFDVSFRPAGFPNSGIPTDVVRNGAYFHRGWLPMIGYQEGIELSDEEARRRFGLAPQPSMPPADDAEARQHGGDLRDADRVHVKAIVGTTADQIAVTPGVLRRSWTENGRRYFHYETEASTSFGYVFYSAEYALLEDRWNDVALRIYHHPTHTVNLDRMVRSTKASLDYYTEHFGPYPSRQLRIVEVSRYAGFRARAHPHMIAFSEVSSFLGRIEEGDVDRHYFVTAHEIAHQWWGGQVEPFSEPLATYSAMMVMEKTYGAEMVRRFYDFEMDLYLRGRASSPRASREVPLLERGAGYVKYHKGALAMYTLRERIGEDRVNTALRRFLETYRDAGPPRPTSYDLYDELRAVTPDSLHALLEDLFETITLWDVYAERARVEPTGTGEYRVTIDVVARKLRADSIGYETEVPMDDLVEIGVFAPGGDDGRGESLYLKRHRIRSGEQTIRITVPREPARAGIDPYHKLIDRARDDNVVAVETAAADRVRPGR